MRTLFALTIIVLIVGIARGTLSPPKSRGKKQGKSTDVKRNYKPVPVDQDVFERGLVVHDLVSADILREGVNHYKDTERRRFSGAVLGYATPWYNWGFTNARIFHGKFTLFSPVWLKFEWGNATRFELPTHDVNATWIKSMKDADNTNHTVKICPRIQFEHWTADDINKLLSNKKRKAQLITKMIDTAKAHRFDGYVLEMWNQFVFTGVNIKDVIRIIKAIAKKLKSNDLDVILAIPPSKGIAVELFSRDSFDQLADDVLAFSLMTYDYSSFQRPGPNSPLGWARLCVEELVPDNDDPRRAQILMGINFYGNNYTPEGGGPIIGSQYMQLLEVFRGKHQWDEGSKEHFFEFKTSGGKLLVFYPTLYSLKKRIDLAMELGTGISIWELGQGLPYFFDLL